MTNPFFTELPPEFMQLESGLKIACRYQPGSGPCLVFLPGYMSDMQGGKAQALAGWAAANDRAMLRLDYSGCGESEGDFADGTLSRWRREVLSAIERYTPGMPVILVGSSMGGWLMLLVASELGERLAGMVGIAAAPDFTDWGYAEAEKAAIAADGVAYEDNPYGPDPTPTFRTFWEDGEAQKLLDGEIDIACPVRLLHGQRDEEVPWDISMQLTAALRSDSVQVSLIKDGDHRLSRPQDIDLLIAAVAGLCGNC